MVNVRVNRFTRVSVRGILYGDYVKVRNVWKKLLFFFLRIFPL